MAPGPHNGAHPCGFICLASEKDMHPVALPSREQQRPLGHYQYNKDHCREVKTKEPKFIYPIELTIGGMSPLRL
jgi:hypothetical protein